MSILDRLLSALGLGSADDRDDREPTVTVEHEPDATDEAAVKGVDAGTPDEPGPSATADTSDGEAEGVGADATDEAGGVDADATDEAGGVDADATVEADASDGETGGVDAGATGEATTTGDSGIRDSPVEEAEPAAGTAESADAGADAAESADADADEAVETVKGIGPAYADRLAEAGVETVGDLAAAAADDLAEHTSLSAKRISRWIDRARSRSADE